MLVYFQRTLSVQWVVFKTDLDINTTSCVIKSSDYPNVSFFGLVEQKCEFAFQKSIKILKNVKIHLSGKNNLSIIIKNGGMEVHTLLKLAANFSETELSMLGGVHNKALFEGLNDNFLAEGGSVEIIVENGNLTLYSSVEADAILTIANDRCKSSSAKIWIQAVYIHFKSNCSSLSAIDSKNTGEGRIIRFIGITLSYVDSSSNLQKHRVNDRSDDEPSIKGCFAVFEILASFHTFQSQAFQPIEKQFLYNFNEMISSTGLTFEDLVNSLLNLDNSYQIDDAYGAVIAENVRKIAMYPFYYTDIDSMGSALTKIVQACEYAVSSVLKTNPNSVEVISNSLAHSLELISLKIGRFLKGSCNYKLETDKTTLEVAVLNKTEPIMSMPAGCKKMECDKVEIPVDIFENDSSVVMVAVVVMNLEQEFFGNELINNSNLWHPVSSLFSISVNSTVSYPFKKPIVLHQYFKRPPKSLFELKAGYWSNNSNWAFDGLFIKSINENEVLVYSYQATTFTILMKITDVPLVSSKNMMALALINYIGCGLSLFCYLLTFSVLLSIRSLTTDRILIHLNLIGSLFVAQTIFLLGVNSTTHKSLCMFVAVLLHYFFTASFGWMLCEGIHLYIKVVSVYSNWIRMPFYYCIGWGTPLVVIIISTAIYNDGYGTENHCWISTDKGLIWAFVGPVLFVIFINMVVMVVVIKILVASLNTPMRSGMVELRQQVKASLKAMVILMPILGISWIFGIISINKEGVIYQYIFTVLSSTQGLFIFLLHCVGNSEVRNAYKLFHEKQKHRNSSARKFSLLVLRIFDTVDLFQK